MRMGVGEWLDRWSEYTPDKIAVVDAASGQRITYRDLACRVSALATSLSERLGIQRGDRVATWAYNGSESLELLFALARLGAILVPVNYRLSTGEIAYILNHAGVKALFHGPEFQAQVATVLADTPIEYLVPYTGSNGPCSFEGLIAAGSIAPKPARTATLDDPLAIIYTSGTTGRPKGAILTHGTITWNAINTQNGWDLGATDIALTTAPFFHTGGLNVLTTPLLHRGGTVVITRQFDATLSLELIERERCTVVFGVPTMFQMMHESPVFATADLGSLWFAIAGGAPCPVSLITTYAARGIVFKQGYGLTEAGPNCFTLNANDAVSKAGSVGFPNFYVSARIVDPAGRDVVAGDVGELLIAGPHVFAGYWRQPEETAKALVGGWLHTGDLVRRDADGYYYIVDRCKDMIISGGENIYPAELEKLLHAHPGIREAAIIGVPDARWGEVGRAVIVTEPGVDLEETDVIAFMARSLARYKLPKSVVFTSELPRNAGGKIVKAELRRLFSPTAVH